MLIPIPTNRTQRAYIIFTMTIKKLSILPKIERKNSANDTPIPRYLGPNIQYPYSVPILNIEYSVPGKPFNFNV